MFPLQTENLPRRISVLRAIVGDKRRATAFQVARRLSDQDIMRRYRMTIHFVTLQLTVYPWLNALANRKARLQSLPQHRSVELSES